MNSAPKQKVITIVGPTASGKTALSIAIAKAFDGEVISADSRQVYKNLDIGTEKVTAEEMDGVPHHLLDVVDVDTIYSADDFKHDADAAINDITSRGKLPIIGGGTFFYIDTLLGKIATPAVPPNYPLREELDTLSTEELFHKLAASDPSRAATIEKDNRRRLLRALEIVDAIGSVPPAPAPELHYDSLTIGIQTDRVALRNRIRSRAEEALTKGLIEETKSLLASGVSVERLQEIGLEYKLCLQYLDNNITDTELIQKLEEKNWQYAKRQLTWLKRDPDIHWFDRTDLPGITTQIQSWLTAQ